MSMRYVDIEKPGGVEGLAIKTGPIPTPQPKEVLIQVFAAGLNRMDILQRKGFYPPPPGASPILGVEVSGTVSAIGSEVTNWKVGDKVCAIMTGGGYAEYCVVPAIQCLPVPKGWSLPEAAGIPETFFTVWANVFMRGRLQPGETLLIHGGSSGIGTTAIQLAKVWGSKVFVTVGNEEKGQACLQLGADGYVNYKTTPDFVSKIRELNGGKGVDVILDMIGGDYFPKNIELLETEGRLVHIAFQKGDMVNVSLKTIMMKRLTITGSTLRARSAEDKGIIASELHKTVWPWLEEKKIRVLVDPYPLEQVAEAHKRMESSEHIGKIILLVDSGHK